MNKIKYGLSNVHIYPITSDDDAGTMYEKGFALKGAVKMSLSAEGSNDPFYADNIPYYVSVANNGYSGSLEIALLNEDFMTKILGMNKDETTGLLVESIDDKSHEFAMAFQFEGDEKAIRHILYRCSATRPSLESETKADKVTPNTDSLDFTAIPRSSDGVIKAKAEKGDSVYDTFFEKPVEVSAKAGA